MTWIRFSFVVIAATLAARSEVLDRIAVSLDNDVITEHQVIQQLRLAAFENHEALNLTPTAKRKAAEQLLERRLIEREMRDNHYAGPEDAAIDSEMKRVKTSFPNDAAYRAALAQYGVTEQQVRQFERDQLATLRFIELRFRPAIQVSDSEMQDYYQNEFVPAWQKESPQKTAPPLPQVHDQLEETITRMRETQALDRWLGETRRQIDIRWQQDVFR